MQEIPAPVLDYACKLIIENRSLAYLLVAKEGQVLSWGGKLSAYGIDNLRLGEYASDRLVFLAGLLPLNGTPVFLPCTGMDCLKEGFCADVHIFAGDEGDWVLLLDASLEGRQQHLMQQKGNELSLLRTQQAKVLEQYFGREAKDQIAEGLLAVNAQGERRDITILLVKICGFTAYSEHHPPEKILKTLNLYLSTLIQSILDEAGLVNKIVGDTVMSLFGVLPSTGYPPVQALKAAFRMLEAVAELNQGQQLAKAFDISIGITSGAVTLGLLGNKASKTLCAIGDRIDLLVQLETQVRPREILIDDNTFAQIKDLQKYFSVTTLTNPGTNTPIATYSYKVGQ